MQEKKWPVSLFELPFWFDMHLRKHYAHYKKFVVSISINISLKVKVCELHADCLYTNGTLISRQMSPGLGNVLEI
jgi:hypothetical protein